MGFKKFCCIFLFSASVFLLFSGCTDSAAVTADNDDSSDIKIISTVFPIYDWVKNIAPDLNSVYLDESGIDLHSFEPTADDIIALSNADIFICIGGISDTWTEAAVKASKNSKLRVIRLMDYIEPLNEELREGMQTEHEHESADEYDEHIWLSLKNAEKCVSAVADILCGIDEKNAEQYLENSQNYISVLSSLDREYESAIASSRTKTLLFADRFPFRYLLNDYSLDYYAAFSGCSAESEASFETMSFLIEKTKQLGLSSVLVLENSDKKIASAVSSATGAEILTLNSCQSITSEQANSGITYISLMESNLAVIQKALS